MAKVDRKNKENQQGEKHSLSSFEKKRGAKVAFNYAQARTNKKYRVVNVQRESRSNSPVDNVSHLDKPTAVSENGEDTKNVKNTAGRTFANGQTANRKTESRTPDAVQKSESSITQPEKTISPEIAQRMKRAAFLQEQNNAKIKMNTASAAVSNTEHSPEKISDTNSAPVISANDSGEKKPYEHKYVSQTADSIIPEQKKAITPEMALRMKRAAFIAQKNEEAIRLNRASVISTEEDERDIISYENDDYPEETENVPLEHQEEQEETQGSSYLGNSEHAVFDTYNNDVRAYRAKNAYGDYVRKQKRNAKESGIDRLAGTAQTVGEISRGEYGKLMTDAVVGSLAGEEAQNVINGIGTVGQAVSGSDSVGSTVLDVSSTLAAIEAKKMVKKLAETDIKDFTKDGANGCFRMGGEEMVAILITDLPEEAVDKAEALRRRIENNVNEIIVDGKPMDYAVTVSIGVHEMQPDVPFTPANAREIFDAEFKKADNAVYEAKETGRNKVVCADEQTYVSYLAMKATEVFVKSEGIEDKEAVKGISDMITDSFAAPTEEQGFDTIVDALRTYAVQTSDTMPDISELADFIADKIEVYSEKISNLNYPVAEDTTVDFEFENQDTNVSDVEFDYDEIFASLDTENSSYYDNVSKSGVGVTFSERVSAMKEWADKALEKVNEKDMQKENVLKKNGGAR